MYHAVHSREKGRRVQLEKNPMFHIAHMQLGVEWNIHPETSEQLEHATNMMHWQGQESSVDVVRTKLLQNMFGVDEKLTTL